MRGKWRAARSLQLALLLAGVCCVAIGAARGEIAVVLRKAVFVCLECIGVAG